MKLPLESNLGKARVVKSEFPGVIFLGKFETQFRSEFLGCEVVGDNSSHHFTVGLMIVIYRSVCDSESTLIVGLGVHKSTPLTTLVDSGSQPKVVVSQGMILA